MQLLRLRELLRFANAHSPYYARIFRERGFDPDSAWQEEDFLSLPVLTRDMVREHSREITSRKGAAWLHITSSGSTSQPVTVLRDKRCHQRIMAARWRAMGWWGVSAHARSAQIWGVPIRRLARSGKGITRDPVKNCLYLSAFGMSDQALPEYARQISRFKPAYVFGYANSLYRLARSINSQGGSRRFPSVRLAISSAEVLFPSQREEISRAFNCPVADFYNASEAGLIAAQCPSGRMHLCAEDLYTEYVPYPGVSGAFTLRITQLSNRKFPLVRYEMDDIVEIDGGDCPCGRTLPGIKNIRGRQFDVFTSLNGNRVHGAFFCYLMDKAGGSGLYRVVQKDAGHIQYHILRSGQGRPVDTGYIGDNVRKAMGEGTRVEFIFHDRADALPLGKAGKFKYVATETA